MLSNSEGSGASNLSLGTNQSLPPILPSSSETVDRVNKCNIDTDKLYSVFISRDKWLLVGLAAFAALLSTVTANIYFPAIPVISRDFHKSVELINLTVTMYIVMQGVSPMVWGTLSDHWGRRPTMIACLATLSLSCVGLALVPTSAYWLLMLLRCLQAAGSASTVVLGAGIIADIATPGERGGFFGLFCIGPLVGPCLGPAIGGALARVFGWRSIFWFLCIGSATFGLVLFLILPETLRAIVGDGSIRAGWVYTPPIPVVGRHRSMRGSDELPPPKPFTSPLSMFVYPDVLILLIFNGTYHAVMYGVTASLSVIFEDVYPNLTQMDVGLCFMALGGGTLIGSWLSGKLTDNYYQKVRDDLVRQAQTNAEKDIDVKALEKDSTFPIEKARLQALPCLTLLYTACVVGYGWALQSRVTIAVPLILQFIVGVVVVVIMNTTQTLLVDLVPNQGSSITACNNIVRCSIGAGMVSVINPILVALGDGWTYTILGGLCTLTSPLVYVEIRWGPVWRERRRQKQFQAALGRG